VRIPSAFLIQKLLRIIVAFVFGMLAGSIIFLYMYDQMMDKVLLENTQLGITNKTLTEDIEDLENDKNELSKKTQQKPIIKKIEIDIVKEKESDTSGFTETEVRERLRNDLKFLITLPLESVAETSETIIHLVNGRKYDINQQQYGLKLETLIIYTTLTVEVSIHHIK
jgi:hypothetical protein